MPPAVVVDDDISLGLQIISSPNPSPAPIMVGNEVKLEASPAAALTSAQWNFDSASTTDVVGSYALVGSPTAAPTGAPTSITSPSPVPTSSNPTRFYWVSGDTSAWQSGGVPAAKHINLVAYATNVQGPLSTDVYYPVAAPYGSVALGYTAVEIPSDYSTDQSSCPGLLTVISLGDTCGTPGMQWDYALSVPSYGTGWLTMAQLVYTQDSGTYANCLGACGFRDGGPPYGLDVTFPYSAAVSTGSHWKSNDSPAFAVAYARTTECTSASYSGNFQDYFLYQPSVPSYRQGTAIWTPTFTISWDFAGSANAPFVALSGHTNPSPSNASIPSLPSWTGLSPKVASECIPPLP